MTTVIIASLLCFVYSAAAQFFGETSCTELQVTSTGSIASAQPPSTIPYTIEVVPSTFHPGNILSVTIRAKDDSRNRYQGIMLQVRPTNHTLMAYGTWVIPPNVGLTFLSCLGNSLGTIASASDDVKTLPLSLAWISPSDPQLPNITIVASFVEEADIFWEKIPMIEVQVIVDFTPPVVNSCPADIFREIQFNSTGVNVNWTEPKATVDTTGPVTVMSNRKPADFFYVGVTNVTYTFSDEEQNKAYCIFNVNVTQDTTPPLVDCPKNINKPVPSGADGRSVDWSAPTATDQSGDVKVISQSHDPGHYFTVGNTVVTYIFEDASGNTALCSFKVIVEEQEDERGVSWMLYASAGGGSILLLILFILLCVFCYRLAKRRRPQTENNSSDNKSTSQIVNSVKGNDDDDRKEINETYYDLPPAGPRYTEAQLYRGGYSNCMEVASGGTTETPFSNDEYAYIDPEVIAEKRYV